MVALRKLMIRKYKKVRDCMLHMPLLKRTVQSTCMNICVVLMQLPYCRESERLYAIRRAIQLIGGASRGSGGIPSGACWGEVSASSHQHCDVDDYQLNVAQQPLRHPRQAHHYNAPGHAATRRINDHLGGVGRYR
eukprot:jgi/Chlat1/6889/Chrsp51S06575